MFKKGSYIYYALGNGMFYFSWAMFSCIISVYLAGINCSATEISLITSAAALFAMATQPITGFLADKFKSPKLVAIITGALTIIFGLLFALTKSFIFLFLLNGFTRLFKRNYRLNRSFSYCLTISIWSNQSLGIYSLCYCCSGKRYCL